MFRRLIELSTIRSPTRTPSKGKHDDQVDSTAQFLEWFKTGVEAARLRVDITAIADL